MDAAADGRMRGIGADVGELPRPSQTRPVLEPTPAIIAPRTLKAPKTPEVPMTTVREVVGLGLCSGACHTLSCTARLGRRRLARRLSGLCVFRECVLGQYVSVPAGRSAWPCHFGFPRSTQALMVGRWWHDVQALRRPARQRRGARAAAYAQV